MQKRGEVMLKISLYKDGRIEKEEVDRSVYEKWMKNQHVGSLYNFNTSKGDREIILLDGDDKKRNFERVMKSKFKRIDEEIKKLNDRKKKILDLSQTL